MNNPELQRILITLLHLLGLAIATAAISVTISRGKIFAPLRKRVMERFPWLGDLISCGYCASHWVAMVWVGIYRPVLIQQWIAIDLVLSVFIVVGLAALLIGAITKLIPFKVEQKDDGQNQDAIAAEVAQLRQALELAKKKILEQKGRIGELQEKH